MITVRHVALPAGLSVLVLKDADGGLTLFVSDSIAPDRQRAAVRVALHASRRSGWRAALVPVLGIWALTAGRGLPSSVRGLLSSVRGLPSGLARLLRAHAAATAVATGLAVAAATVTIALVPHHGSAPQGRAGPGGHSNPVAGGRVTSPSARHSRQGGHRLPAVPGATPTGTAVTGTPAPHPSPTRATAPPSPVPTSRPPSPTPTPTGSPTPSPKPSGGNGGTCVWLLGIKVCVAVHAGRGAPR